MAASALSAPECSPRPWEEGGPGVPVPPPPTSNPAAPTQGHVPEPGGPHCRVRKPGPCQPHSSRPWLPAHLPQAPGEGLRKEGAMQRGQSAAGYCDRAAGGKGDGAGAKPAPVPAPVPFSGLMGNLVFFFWVLKKKEKLVCEKGWTTVSPLLSGCEG